MKIRLGFVSNSSSSSYTAILDKETYNRLPLTAIQKVVVEELSREEKLGNQVLKIFHTYSDDNGYDIQNLAELQTAALEEFPDQQNEVQTRIDEEEFSYFHDLWWDALGEIKELFTQLKKEGQCIIFSEYY